MPLSGAGIPARVPPLCGEPRREKTPGRRLKGCQAEELDGVPHGGRAPEPRPLREKLQRSEPGRGSRLQAGSAGHRASNHPAGTWQGPGYFLQSCVRGTARLWSCLPITGQGQGGRGLFLQSQVRDEEGVVLPSSHRAGMGRVWSLPPITGQGWGGCAPSFQSQGRDKGRDWSLHLSRGRMGSGPCLHFPNPH